jgi:formate hydrogenlyase subunit 4
MFLHLHTEIGLALFLAGVALNANALDIAALNRDQFAAGWLLWLSPQWLLLAGAFAIIVMYEAGRVPVGNPEGELELPKGQEGIPDHYGGRDLLLIRWAEAARLTFLLFLGISLFPWPPSPRAGVTALVSLAQLLVAVLLLAFWEASRPRLRLRKVGGPMLLSAVFSLTAILYTLVAGGS